MTNSNGLQQSLDAMGFVELTLAFVALTAYGFALSGSLPARGRVIAAAIAVATAGGFVALAAPWTNGVILLAFGLAILGLFVAIVWALSAACGLNAVELVEPVAFDPEIEPELEHGRSLAAADATAGHARPPSSPAHST